MLVQAYPDLPHRSVPGIRRIKQLVPRHIVQRSAAQKREWSWRRRNAPIVTQEQYQAQKRFLEGRISAAPTRNGQLTRGTLLSRPLYSKPEPSRPTFEFP